MENKQQMYRKAHGSKFICDSDPAVISAITKLALRKCQRNGIYEIVKAKVLNFNTYENTGVSKMNTLVTYSGSYVICIML